VVKKPLILDPSQYDVEHVVADIETIRRHNRQRFEMEQLTAVCYEDTERHIVLGYKDLGTDEFWARGHMPGMPLMPGVIMCEAAAQLASYYCHKHKLVDGVVGFGGLEEVRFRGIVRPGDRFIVACKMLKFRRSLMTCSFQGIVGDNLVCEGVLKGISLPVDLLTSE
jgi:3-hydroxyacyl-[acyl-carrier-protein] dehydratase